MASGILSAELSATCNALGYSSGSTYHLDTYAKESITDLIRYLRRDDDDHTIRRHLGKAKILKTDLIPILIHHSSKEELFDVLLRLLVNLTNPALMIYQEEVPTERTARHNYLEIVSHLESYKEAFTDQTVWEVLVRKLEKLLNVKNEERDEDQNRTIERILILARNVLHVSTDSDAEKRPDNDASVHDQVLWSLYQAGLVDLFHYIASNDSEHQYYLHILEIISLILREQNPASLASAALQRSVEDKEQDVKDLLQLRQKEIKEKQSKARKYASSRHSRFGGTYVMKDIKSISDKDLIFHKSLDKAVSLELDLGKQHAKVPKNKLALSHPSSERRSAFSVRIFLKNFCVEFLNGAYNILMYKVRENLVRGEGQPNDETYYFWAMKFFMEFNRLYNFKVKLISETMHQQIFHFVQRQMENWLEMMVTDKKRIPLWSWRVHTALKAYQELLMTLHEMEKSPDETVKRSASVIKRNIFYQSEYRELIIFLFNGYDKIKFSREYLKDLLETTHIFMKMLSHFCKQNATVVVQEKAKRRPAKKKKRAKRQQETDLNVIWETVGAELSAILQGGDAIPEDVVPFDAASGLSMEEEKVKAMKRIKTELMQGNIELAVGLLRAAREVWPENDSFGRADMPPEEEFLAMREIFMSDIGQLPELAPRVENDEENEADNEEEEDAQDIVIPESVFKFTDFVSRFATPKVLETACLLMEGFERNSSFTNNCILKLLHRVAVDLKLPEMLFQGTVFMTFDRILDSQNPDHKGLRELAKHIMRKCAVCSKENPKMSVEMVDWKTKKEAYELKYGYGSDEVKSHSAKNVWGEEHEDELRRLANEYEENTPDDEPDAVTWIMKNMIDQSRSRKAVMKKLKELCIFVGNVKPKRSKEMTEEEISQLRSLYETYRESPDPMNCILTRLSVPRGRNVIVRKLLDLELVKDRKELRKKREKKSKKQEKEMEWGDRSDDESIYDSWSDDSAGPSTSQKKNHQKTTVKQRSIPTEAQMCSVLKKVLEEGLREPLVWLNDLLKEELQDYFTLNDNPDYQGAPLLAVSDVVSEAMQNPTFLQLLDIFSIDKPNDQEAFWRIPATMKSDDFVLRTKLIGDALDGKLSENPDAVEEENLSETLQEVEPKSPSKMSPERFVSENRNSRKKKRLHSSSSEEDQSKRPALSVLDEDPMSEDNSQDEKSTIDMSLEESVRVNSNGKKRNRISSSSSEGAESNCPSFTETLSNKPSCSTMSMEQFIRKATKSDSKKKRTWIMSSSSDEGESDLQVSSNKPERTNLTETNLNKVLSSSVEELIWKATRSDGSNSITTFRVNSSSSDEGESDIQHPSFNEVEKDNLERKTLDSSSGKEDQSKHVTLNKPERTNLTETNLNKPLSSSVEELIRKATRSDVSNSPKTFRVNLSSGESDIEHPFSDGDPKLSMSEKVEKFVSLEEQSKHLALDGVDRKLSTSEMVEQFVRLDKQSVGSSC